MDLMGTPELRILKLICSEETCGKSDVISQKLRQQFCKVEPAMSQGGVSLEMGSLHSISSTVYFLQHMECINSDMVQREVLLLQSQVRSARGMECSSSAAALFPWDTDLQLSRCLCIKKGGHPQLTMAMVADLHCLAVTASASPGSHEADGDALD